MRLATPQTIWQRYSVVLDRARVSFHSSARVSTRIAIYVIFVTAISDIVFWLCVKHEMEQRKLEQHRAFKMNKKY